MLFVDNAPLQQAAWKRLRSAQRRLEKATRELHRYENEDEPAFQRWIQQTFPHLLSELRELAWQMRAKVAIITDVENEAWATGRSPTQVWIRRKRREALAKEAAETFGRDPEDSAAAREADEEEPGFYADDDEEEAGWGDSARRGIDPDLDEEARRDFGRALGRGFGDSSRGDDEAKQIYRRLVQRLHPDAGGEWTPKREALWHQVQQAWDARDADWLARLDAELELAEETLGPASPLSRLYEALREIEAARRDAEKTVRQYRKMPAWGFAARTPGMDDKRVYGTVLRSEVSDLRAQVHAFDRMIKGWERAAKMARTDPRTERYRRASGL